MNYKGTGLYQCYCSKYKDVEAPFCQDYTYDIIVGFGLSNVVSIGITVVNMVIRIINIGLITFIGYYTESEQTKAVKTSVFISQFFNTAILLLLTNANT